MTQRELFKETFSQLHASPDTLSEVMNMAKHENITYMNKTKRHPARKLIAVVAVAALLVTGVFAAGTAIYKMTAEPIGEYGLSLMVDFEEGAASAEAAETPVLDITPGWLPEGMMLNPNEKVKWSYEDTPFQGGFSIKASVLNAGNKTFRETITGMESRESLMIGEHEAVYVKMVTTETDNVKFNQRLYVAYPEFNQVLCVFVGEDIDKDTAVRFVENLIITETGEYLAESIVKYHGQLYREAEQQARWAAEPSATENETVEKHHGDMPVTTISEEEIGHIYSIGESFDFRNFSDQEYLSVKVTKVEVTDSIDVLRDPACLKNSEEVQEVLKNGYTMSFVKNGDGVNTLAEIVETREKDAKLVAVTMEFTNETDAVIEDVIYHPVVTAVEETADGWALREKTTENGKEWDYYQNYYSWLGGDEMIYYDIIDADSNGGNHIKNIEPGETVTLQVAFVVNDEDANELFLNMDYAAATTFEVDDPFVDIRQ